MSGSTDDLNRALDLLDAVEWCCLKSIYRANQHDLNIISGHRMELTKPARDYGWYDIVPGEKDALLTALLLLGCTPYRANSEYTGDFYFALKHPALLAVGEVSGPMIIVNGQFGPHNLRQLRKRIQHRYARRKE